MNKPRVPWSLPRSLCLLCLLVLGVNSPAAAQLRLDDAQRFTRLLEQTAYRPSTGEIERDYRLAASPGLEQLLRRDGIDAAQLGTAIETQRFAYRHAIELCLPAMRRITDRVAAWLAGLDELLGGSSDAQLAVVFGAGTTGGMVQGQQIVIALEVQCRFADSPATAAQVLESAILHEAVHLHQLRRQQAGARDSLLRQALLEGFAEWVSMRQLGVVPPQARERVAYGSANEARLWHEFRAEMDGLSLGRWMYGPGREGEPADLGYWIGSQIIAAYMAQAGEEPSALETLLLLESPVDILKASAYDPGRPIAAAGQGAEP